MGIISMSLELQREAGEYLASLRIRERPNNGVRLLIDTTSSTTTTAPTTVMKMEQVSISPSFYEQLFYTKVLFSVAYMYLQFYFVMFWHKKIGKKAAR